MSAPKHYTAEDLEGLDRQTLAIIAEARGLDVEGSGRGGYETVEDYRSAITEHQDRTGVNPGLVAQTPEPTIVKFIVTGGVPVYGMVAGQTFSTTSTPQTDLLVEGGAIAPAPDDEAPAPMIVPVEPEVTEGDSPSEEPHTEES